MSEGTLPVRYLGVPLITKRLSAVDCDTLVAKIISRIESWLVKLYPLQAVFSLSPQSFAVFMFFGPESSYSLRK
jgi:hypothetical protein